MLATWQFVYKSCWISCLKMDKVDEGFLLSLGYYFSTPHMMDLILKINKER